MSSLERGLKGPTLEKVNDLATVIGVHPLTLLVACYLEKDAAVSLEEIFDKIRSEL